MDRYVQGWSRACCNSRFCSRELQVTMQGRQNCAHVITARAYGALSFVCMCVRAFTCVCLCMYVCMYVCIHIHIHKRHTVKNLPKHQHEGNGDMTPKATALPWRHTCPCIQLHQQHASSQSINKTEVFPYMKAPTTYVHTCLHKNICAH
jgi:hypothetical protein